MDELVIREICRYVHILLSCTSMPDLPPPFLSSPLLSCIQSSGALFALQNLSRRLSKLVCDCACVRFSVVEEGQASCTLHIGVIEGRGHRVRD